MIHRFFVSPDQIRKNKITILGSDVNHIKNVLRLKTGNEINILDGTGKIYAVKIFSLTRDEIKCEITSWRSIKTESEIKVIIAQAIGKGGKMDLVIQKSTELGVIKIIPIQTERTVVKIKPERMQEKIERWRRIAKEAAEQCGRLVIPTIEKLIKFKELMLKVPEFDLALIPWELAREQSIKPVLQSNKRAKKILVLIGPEGGFSKEEVDEATKSGFIPVTLGKRILRTETAPLAILSMITYEFEL